MTFRTWEQDFFGVVSTNAMAATWAMWECFPSIPGRHWILHNNLSQDGAFTPEPGENSPAPSHTQAQPGPAWPIRQATTAIPALQTGKLRHTECLTSSKMAQPPPSGVGM